MNVDGYAAWSASTGPSFIVALSNAEVALLAFALFTIAFALAAFLARNWLADVAFLVLVAGGILVAWPAMIALSMSAVLVAAIVSFAHKALLPERAARIEAEATAASNAMLRRVADEPGLADDARRLLREQVGDRSAARKDER